MGCFLQYAFRVFWVFEDQVNRATREEVALLSAADSIIEYLYGILCLVLSPGGSGAPVAWVSYLVTADLSPGEVVRGGPPSGSGTSFFWIYFELTSFCVVWCLVVELCG